MKDEVKSKLATIMCISAFLLLAYYIFVVPHGFNAYTNEELVNLGKSTCCKHEGIETIDVKSNIWLVYHCNDGYSRAYSGMREIPLACQEEVK